jgi:two-component system cell cycle sensor histidine kinase/response regulator CckA
MQFSQSSETILIVEDDDVVRELLCEILGEMYGYCVLEARDGLEAISVFEENENRIDLVITDVMMPMMSGLSLGNLLSFSRVENRILYISGFAESGEEDELQKRENFIEKPFTPETIACKVREMLDKLDKKEQ